MKGALEAVSGGKVLLLSAVVKGRKRGKARMHDLKWVLGEVKKREERYGKGVVKLG